MACRGRLVPYLVAGSNTETDREAIAETAQPEGVSADEHAAHHAKPAAKPIGPADAGIGVSCPGCSIRRDCSPDQRLRGLHHTAIYS